MKVTLSKFPGFPEILVRGSPEFGEQQKEIRKPPTTISGTPGNCENFFCPFSALSPEGELASGDTVVLLHLAERLLA